MYPPLATQIGRPPPPESLDRATLRRVRGSCFERGAPPPAARFLPGAAPPQSAGLSRLLGGDAFSPGFVGRSVARQLVVFRIGGVYFRGGGGSSLVRREAAESRGRGIVLLFGVW